MYVWPKRYEILEAIKPLIILNNDNSKKRLVY